RPVTVKIEEGVPPGGKVRVNVREQPATKKRPRRWAVSVTVTFSLLLAVGLLALRGLHSPPRPQGDSGVKSTDDRLAKGDKGDRPAHPLRDLPRVRTPRVSLAYETEVNAAQAKVELPFVIGVLADLSGDPKEPRRPLKDRPFLLIDRDN